MSKNFDVSLITKGGKVDYDKVPIEVIRSKVYELLDSADTLVVDPLSVKFDFSKELEGGDLSLEIKDYETFLSQGSISLEDDFVYLAGPFFNYNQRFTVCYLEYYLDKLGYKVFSPSRDGVVLNNETDSIERRKEVFKDNVVGVENSSLVLAIIDDRDPGTYFEVGNKYVFDALNGNLVDDRANIITYSGHDYGVNLMIINSSRGHYTTISDLIVGLSKWSLGKSADAKELQSYEVE